MILVLYEDNIDDFYPLANLYSQYMIRIGTRTIADHIQSWFPRASMGYLGRFVSLREGLKLRGTVIFISARFLPTEGFPIPKKDRVLTNKDTVVGLVRHGPPYPDTIKKIKLMCSHIKQKYSIKGHTLQAMWDLIRYNTEFLNLHDSRFKTRSIALQKVKILGKKQHVLVAHGAVVHEGVVLDVTDGPVIIDSDACIRPFTTITGPSYIGVGTIVDRAKITASTIGPVCRIGGEVEASIFQGYANKSHEGFIGHSFIGEWVNLGAMTTNSDLKNNYGPVRVRLRKKLQDTGMTKVGCFIGDHSKTGINTLIPTGAVIGSFVNFFGGGMMPPFVRDFSWLTTGHEEIHVLEKAMVTARIVMKRRERIMTRRYIRAIKECYKCRDS